MNILEIIIISIGLSLDVFTSILCKGAMLAKIEKTKLINLCLIFSFWQVAALLFGNLITIVPVVHNKIKELSIVGQLLSVIIFFTLGLYMLWKSWKEELIFEHREEKINYKEIFRMAFITSLDAFLAGIAFAFLNIKISVQVIALLIITILVVVIGIYTGYRLGYKHRRYIYALGGVLLIIASIDIIRRYLIL